MRLQILGTAAAEGIPAIFCGCSTCQRARASGGKDIRGRASVQIDDIYKIDLPPDTLCQSVKFDLHLDRLKYLFYTHSHGDHFAPHEIEYTRPSFAYDLKNAPIRVYANSKVIGAIKATCERHPLPLELHIAEPFVPIAADHLTFTPIIASHAAGELCLNYIVQSETATVLYASDTGPYGFETLDFLSRQRFDLLIIECTRGTSILPGKVHMSLRDVLKLRSYLERTGAAGPWTRTVITHLSHNIGLLHAELERITTPKRIEVAYDGMVLEF